MQVPDVRSNGRVTFVLTYDELLKRVRGQYEQRINVAPQQVRTDDGLSMPDQQTYYLSLPLYISHSLPSLFSIHLTVYALHPLMAFLYINVTPFSVSLSITKISFSYLSLCLLLPFLSFGSLISEISISNLSQFLSLPLSLSFPLSPSTSPHFPFS